MVEITNREQFKEWLRDKPREWAQVLAMRVAMRAIPLIPLPLKRRSLTLAVFRAIFISWAAARYPDDDLTNAADYAAQAAAGSSARSAKDAYWVAQAADFAVSAINAGPRAVYTRAVDAAVATSHVVPSIYARDLFLPLTSVIPDEGAVWAAIEADANWLAQQVEGHAQNHAKLLAVRKLWLSGTPQYFMESWAKFQRELKSFGWSGWGDEWYARRLVDKTSGFDLPVDIEERLIFRLTHEDKYFWKEDPDKVSKEITERIAVAQLELAANKLPSELEESPPAIPEQKAGPLTTFLRDGRVAKAAPPPPERSDAAHELLRQQSHGAMLHAIEDFEAAGMAGNNPGLLHALARMKTALAGTVETMDVIASGTVAERIHQYALRANDIFMAETAAEVVALNVTMARHMAQFAEWQRYVGVVERDLGAGGDLLALEVAVARVVVADAALEPEASIGLQELIPETGGPSSAPPTAIERTGFERGLSNVLATVAKDAVKEAHAASGGSGGKKSYLKDAGDAIYDGHMDGLKEGSKKLTTKLLAGSATALGGLAAYAAWHWLLPVLIFLGLI